MRTNVIHAVGLAALASLTIVCTADAQQPSTSTQSAWGRVADPTSFPVVLTIEGGGSLGVYEAGMTWTLVELFKQQQDAGRRDSRFPSLQLASVSGASAGSINALLAATIWCDRRAGEAPEQSPFWQMWVTTGVSQLLPRAKPGQDEFGRDENGVFSRAYFDSVLFPMLLESWRDTSTTRWRRTCEVPVGATMTRLIADTMRLTPYIAALNQRVGVSFDVRVDASGRRLQFAPRPRDRAQRALGSILGLPTMPDGLLSPESLLPVIKASSGYPLAFQPQRVFFLKPNASYPCVGSCDRDSALFVDGGVFDNGPISLGLGLYFGGPYWGMAGRTAAKPFPYVLFVGPDQRRDLVASRGEQLTRAEVDRSDLRGVAAVLRLATEAVPVARQYELQNLIRLLDADRAVVSSPCATEGRREDCFLVTDRFHPLMGSRMSGFGGFLGRPFREYDFYAGIYDAFVLIARHIPSDGPSCAQRASVIESASAARGALAQCIQVRLAALISNPPIPLGDVAPRMLRELYRSEFGPVPSIIALVSQQGTAGTGASILSASDSTMIVLRAVHGAMMKLMHDLNTPAGEASAAAQRKECGVQGPLSGLMCEEGLRSLMRSIRVDGEAMAVLKGWHAATPCDFGNIPHSLQASKDCRADRRLLTLLEHPVPGAHRTMRAILRRADYGTPHSDTSGVGATLAHVAGFAYLSSDSRYRRGFDMGQTSLPELEGFWSNLLWHAIPSTVGFPIGQFGTDLGWDVRWNVGETVSFVAPLRMRMSTMRDDADEQTRTSRAGSGLGVELRLPPGRVPVTSIRLEGLAWQRFDHGASRGVPLSDRITAGITATLFAGKVRVGIESRSRAAEVSNTPLGSAAIGDVNGILHWLLLRNRKH